jgi:hypothetical protein
MSNINRRLRKAEKAIEPSKQGIHRYEDLLSAFQNGETIDWKSTPYLRRVAAKLRQWHAEGKLGK